jgi:hypothetical protein
MYRYTQLIITTTIHYMRLVFPYYLTKDGVQDISLFVCLCNKPFLVAVAVIGLKALMVI